MILAVVTACGPSTIEMQFDYLRLSAGTGEVQILLSQQEDVEMRQTTSSLA